MEPPTSYSVRAHVAAGVFTTVTVGYQPTPVDATWAANDSPGTPGPAELLTAAFAACLMKDLERSSALLSFHYEHADVDAFTHTYRSVPGTV